MLCTGDIRHELGKDLMKSVKRMVDANAKRFDDYYILVHTQIDPDQPTIIRTKLILLTELPPTMLGTVLFHVNNRKGTIETMHVLPLDVPTDGIEMAEGNETIFDTVRDQNIPIIHN